MGVQEVKEQLKSIFRQVINNDKWITKYDKEGEPYHVNIDDTEDKEEKKESDTKDGKEEKKSTFKPVKGIMQSLKDDYEAGKINAKEVAKELSKANLTPYLLDDSEALEKIGVKQSGKKEEKYEIPKDYKDSVKGYSKEKHEQAADFYGEKMATVQKKSVAHPENEDYRKQFEEYKALKDYHEEKAKSDSKGENEKYRSRFPDIQNLIGTLSKDDKYFDSKYRTAEKRLNEKLKFAKKELKERDFADMPSVKKSKEQIVKTIEEEIEKLKLMKDKNKQLRLFNNKEQDMALIEELKKLITKVENTKGEKDMEIENEKVDKRDIIRQIMAIAGKEEASEDVKTIAKLAEKLAYDKSEAGTADNKCKNEDDEKEVEEVKEDVKEDVENKCKNSVDNSKVDYFAKLNEIYNSASQIKEETEYVSQADREKAAEDYFAK